LDYPVYRNSGEIKPAQLGMYEGMKTERNYPVYAMERSSNVRYMDNIRVESLFFSVHFLRLRCLCDLGVGEYEWWTSGLRQGKSTERVVPPE
jgi:hypothetical protein